MELTPSQISGASFRTVRKGYDPAEVDGFLRDAAAALEQAQQQATAMEARARAAVARLQEQQQAPVTEPAPAAPEPERADRVHLGADEAETISRTLLLAQRTADSTVAEAEAEADRIRTSAREESETTLDSTREMSARLIEEARAEARKASETERIAAANAVESLKARREFLLGDVDQLETFLVEQRERLRGAARQLEALCERVPSGLGHVGAPVLSASDDEPGDDTNELFLPPEARMPFAGADELVDAIGDEPLSDGRSVDTGELDLTAALDGVNAPDLPVRGQADPNAQLELNSDGSDDGPSDERDDGDDGDGDGDGDRDGDDTPGGRTEPADGRLGFN
jgi:DivIVA domain-containing protein